MLKLKDLLVYTTSCHYNISSTSFQKQEMQYSHLE